MIWPNLHPFDRFAFLGSVDEDMTFQGVVQFAQKPGLPAGTIGDFEIDATEPLGVTKTRKQYLKDFTQDTGAAVGAKTQVFHMARGAGTLKDVRAMLVTPNGAASTVTIDIRKAPAGGPSVSVLTGNIVIPASGAAYTFVVGLLDPAQVNYNAGDVFIAVVTVAGGAVGQGLGGYGTFDEVHQ